MISRKWKIRLVEISETIASMGPTAAVVSATVFVFQGHHDYAVLTMLFAIFMRLGERSHA